MTNMNKENNENKFEKALKQMSNTFSSNAFCDKVKKYGVSPYLITNGVCGAFLHTNCIQDNNSKRIWHKRNVNINNQSLHDLEILSEEKNAVALLKSLGYKLLKPISEWKEV